MSDKISVNIFLIVFLLSGLYAQDESQFKKSSAKAGEDTVSLFLDYLNILSVTSSHNVMSSHCGSIKKLIESTNLSQYEVSFINQMYRTFTDNSVDWCAGDLNSYLERKRPFIISWVSSTDSVVSLAWMIPPKNWEISHTYPLYVSLHGLYQPYSNPVEYMARYLSSGTVLEKSFDDGYSIYPWGRGNLWYEGIGGTDVWESIDALDKLVNIDPGRRYLVGHSMGGYGAWVIGQNSAAYWAGIGVYAGALWYNGGKYLNSTAAEKLKDVPVYIVCGTQDGLLNNNQTAYNLLLSIRNDNTYFTTFQGGHESTFENWENMYQWLRKFSNEGSTSVGYTRPALKFELLENFPNPFNPATTITYIIPKELREAETFISLKVYNMLGEEITTLVNKNHRTGIYQVKFNSVTSDGKSLSGGIYLCNLNVSDYSGNLIYKNIKKMVLLK